MTTTFLPESANLATSSPIRLGADAHTCPECNANLTATHNVDGLVVACPDCGQCVAAPASWVCQTTEWGLVRPQWPFRHTKYSGWVAICMGLPGLGIAAVPTFSVWARAGAACLGAALFLEGVFRLIDKARKNATARPAVQTPTPDSTQQFGALKAAFVSRNSVSDSLLLCLMAAAGGCGVMWVATWLGNGGMHPKLLLIVAIVPLIIAYIVYRSVCLALKRQYVVIRDHGMDVGNGVTRQSFAWSDVWQITAVHLGDAIDEDAIDIQFHDARKKARFTRALFPDLETLWARILQEAGEQIELGKIDVESINKAQRQSRV